MTPTFPSASLRRELAGLAGTGTPTRTRVAAATKSTSSVLETKGKERLTRRLHSITFSSSSCNHTDPISTSPQLKVMSCSPSQ